MAEIGIFATQERTQWVQDMLDANKLGFGYTERNWIERGLLCFDEAGVVGKTLTGTEIRRALRPYIGPGPSRSAINDLTKRGRRWGILNMTGTKRRIEGSRNKQPEYEIVGHLEIDDAVGGLVAVGMREQRH